MRYYYEKPNIYLSMYGKIYICNHPIYTKCTLYKISDKGLAVIQQRFNPVNKTTWWGEIDPWLIDDIYLHPKFKKYFDKNSDKSENGIYPTVTIRQIMWALRMKPIKRQRWETVFDRRLIQREIYKLYYEKVFQKGDIYKMNERKRWTKKPVTWGGYTLLCVICFVIGSIITAVSYCVTFEPTWWKKLKTFIRRPFQKRKIEI